MSLDKFFKRGHMFEEQIKEDMQLGLIPDNAKYLINIADIRNVDYKTAYNIIFRHSYTLGHACFRSYIKYIRMLMTDYNHKKKLDKKNKECYTNNSRKERDINGFA